MKDLTKPLDVRNLGCPIPAINVRKALKRWPGHKITILCNSMDALKDIKAVLNDTGAVLDTEWQDNAGKVSQWTLVVTAPPAP